MTRPDSVAELLAGGGRKSRNKTETKWRLIQSGCLSGPANMAVDEALLRIQQKQSSPPVLRLYGWSRPTVSLGYSQKINPEELCRRNPPGSDLVRRITGGWAIFHHRELTYCLAGRPGEFTLPRGVGAGFVHISRGIIRGLQLLGVRAGLRGKQGGISGLPPDFFCFHDRARYDIVVGNRKLVGSAQRWKKGAFIQQGSVMIGPGPGLEDGIYLESLLGRQVSQAEVEDCLVKGFAGELGIEFERGELLPEEKILAEKLTREKYASREWTLFGRHVEPGDISCRTSI